MGRRPRVRIGLVEVLDLVAHLRSCHESELAEALIDHTCEFLALIGVQQETTHDVVCIPDAAEFVAALLRGADALRYEGGKLLLAELEDAGERCVRMAAALGVASASGLGRRVRVETGLDGIPVLVVGGHRG